MINKRYTTQFSNSRMVWYDEEAELEENISFYGHLQQMTAELTQSLGLTFTKAYTIWCPLNTDVVVGDEIKNGDDKYIIKAIKDLSIGINKHKQLFVEKEETYA